MYRLISTELSSGVILVIICHAAMSCDVLIKVFAYTLAFTRCYGITYKYKTCVLFVVDLLSKQWRIADKPGEELPSRVFSILPETTTFAEYYDETQHFLKAVSGMDPLLESKRFLFT